MVYTNKEDFGFRGRVFMVACIVYFVTSTLYIRNVEPMKIYFPRCTKIGALDFKTFCLSNKLSIATWNGSNHSIDSLKST